MKKMIIMSLIIGATVFQYGCSAERGHSAYVKHSKNHKVQKVPRLRVRVDPTYN